MTRDQIDRRIDNERKLRNEGYSNREIAQIMGVGYHTVINEIGKEPLYIKLKNSDNIVLNK